ncbi:hypothetical protein B0H13DRAFT_2674199 [Mycena leptocephala]|nr:hypothetical protein B0H13DRAFT_2674199 [Mycena leptocephala]
MESKPASFFPNNVRHIQLVGVPIAEIRKALAACNATINLALFAPFRPITHLDLPATMGTMGGLDFISNLFNTILKHCKSSNRRLSIHDLFFSWWRIAKRTERPVRGAAATIGSPPNGSRRNTTEGISMTLCWRILARMNGKNSIQENHLVRLPDARGLDLGRSTQKSFAAGWRFGAWRRHTNLGI